MRLAILFLATATAVQPWTIPFLHSDSSDSSVIRLHPSSVAETDPSSARAKRQAYQVYVDGDTSVTVDKSGEAETGPWGQWVPEGTCSRTCGGGVQTEKRTCSGECTGPSVRYVSCGLDKCTEAGDFRSSQCSAHNDEAVEGKYYKWVPYRGKNKCELLCKPEGSGNFYFKWGEKVVDGTSCDAKGTDVCVDGVCLPVGCDGKLGSDKKFDKCGVCDGKGDTCKTVEGQFDERNLSPGYHDIIKLPVGATAIRVSELRDTSNNLALKNATGDYVLNGNSMIQTESDIETAGTVFEYEDNKKESLVAQGPLTEEVTVALLHRKGNKDSAIKYEFSVPLDDDVPYLYKPGEWSACSVTCGKGVQTRNPVCFDTNSNAPVADELCDENNSTKPETEKECLTTDCEAEWFTGDWETCSSTCGNTGEQYRVVYCHQVFRDGKRITVDDGNCTEARPEVRQGCNRFSCPEWQAGPWSACSEKCGDAFQYRSVTCRSEKEGEEGKLLAAEQCDSTEEMETQRTCNLGPCEGLKFTQTEWKLCTRCNETEETREVKCVDTQGRAYPLEKCQVNGTEIPIDTRTCATQPPCIYEWTTSEWSKCSTECGHGSKTRRVVCAIHQEGDLEVVDESHCQGQKPDTKEECTNESDCTGTWFSGPWTDCSAECDGGKQTRVSVCLNYDHKPEPKWCDEAKKPADEQDCNTDACPTCFDSEFGCCPDNSTFATGDFYQGCSNCSLSEFGCCADNVTEATGANALGCIEYVELEPVVKEDMMEKEEGSGETATDDEEQKECKVTSEDGTEANVECGIIASNLTAVEEGDLMGNETGNATIHCSKTEFGCCPDWFTPAEGPNNAGCETFVQGACNGTQFGCCLDNVNLARGPNYEACGEPSCAASLYGCCKDRKTIAFGPHYAGCERSSFPCELSPHGCCPDGETAALGKNGTGCGEDCLTTKFGCCPDGKTVSKGNNNEGCGCEFAQFGCCPDGKSAAKGAGFYGCPQSCAQSQYGCCPDGKTSARGAHKEGCPCQYTRYGCCPDGETTSLGPNREGCDDCRYAKHGCCSDGITRALGPDFAGCPTTTIAPFIEGGTVAPSKIGACALPQDQGKQCSGTTFKLMWAYDANEGRCSQFWYGGCEGNDNRFATKDMCETICIDPPGKGRCYLPKIEGPAHCNALEPKFYYDANERMCKAFWWRGCLGNSNNFANWAECTTFCSGVEPVTEAPVTEAPPPPPPVYPTEVINYEVESGPVAPVAPEQQPQQPQQSQQQPAPRTNPYQTIEDVCRSEPDAGPCTDFVEKYFYSTASGKCERFRYGGCGGNLNSFTEESECLLRCGFMSGRAPQAPQPTHAHPQPPPPAANHMIGQPDFRQPQPQPQPVHPIVFPVGPVAPAPPPSNTKSRSVCNEKVDVGRCEGSFTSYYYEVATGTCVDFKYSGCGGNGNRFTTKAECEGLCMRSAAPASTGLEGSPCEQRKDTGQCPDAGNTNYVTKWYYNQADGVCTRFHYSGCGGTANRYDTEQDCRASCDKLVSPCEKPIVQGLCSGKHVSFGYNKQTGRCEEFLYSGCLGNTNRFNNLAECQTTCPERGGSRSIVSSLPSLSLPITANALTEAAIGKCSLPKEIGLCKALIASFYYDSTLGRCAPFNYGGCGGNANRFRSIEECQKECEPEKQQALRMNPNAVLADAPRPVHSYRSQGRLRERTLSRSTRKLPIVEEKFISLKTNKVRKEVPHEIPSTTTTTTTTTTTSEPSRPLPVDDIDDDLPLTPSSYVPTPIIPELCMLPMEKGGCFAKELRWHYDDVRDMCVSFFYTGCGANANNFESQESCERACGAFRDVRICEQPSEAGECSTAVMKWHWDTGRKACKPMVWGGCGGNGNRFSSRSECEQLCKHETAYSADTDVCLMATNAGPCNDAVSMWHYDVSIGSCRKFTYGGCRGNGNRFLTKKDCEKRCNGVRAPAALPTPAALVDTRNIPMRRKHLPSVTVPEESIQRPISDSITLPLAPSENEITVAKAYLPPVSEFSLGAASAPSTVQHTLQTDVCHAPMDVGPCSDMIESWFYDRSVDQCQQFAYGGCEGNSNRFASRIECLKTCKPGDYTLEKVFTKKEKKTTLKTHEEGPFPTGSEIRLSCDSSESRPIVWYKDGGVLEFSERITEEDGFKTVVIGSAQPTDSGYYMCAVGVDGVFSERVHVKVNELPVQESFCTDVGGRDTCAKILARGLCSMKRYGSYCCRTCGSHGFEKFRF